MYMAEKKKKVKESLAQTTVRTALAKGDIYTKMSAILMGTGNFARGQICKGLIYLIAEISFLFFLITQGMVYLKGLTTLGIQETGEIFNEKKQIYEYTAGDNSMLFLFYGILTLFIIAGFILIWRTAVKSAFEAQRCKEMGRKAPGIRADIHQLFDKKLYGSLLFFPVLCVVLFTIMPLAFMICMAFTNYDRNHQPPGTLFDWVGIANFQKLFDVNGGLGYAFWHVLGWTIVWAILATALNYIFGMILAIIINRKETRIKGFWRFVFVLSIAVPQFVSLLIMRTMLQEQGAINVLLQNLGLISGPLPFWTNTMWARVTVIIINLWVGIPFTMLQVTGILQNIPQELYEAAKVDGANVIVTFFKITLPYMLFVTAPYLITQFIGNINNFNVIYLLTEGKPATMDYFNGTAGKTDLLVTWLYKLTVDFKDYNYAAVIGIAVFVLSAIFSLAAYRRTGSYKDEEGFQ